LRAAVEGARAFERRGSDEYQRRVGAYDRLLDNAPGRLATIVGIDPLTSKIHPVPDPAGSASA
jgi:hypothetical protein